MSYSKCYVSYDCADFSLSVKFYQTTTITTRNDILVIIMSFTINNFNRSLQYSLKPSP